KPFFGGTYFPPVEKYGRPSFTQISLHFAKLWKSDRTKILDYATEATQAISQSMNRIGEKETLDKSLFRSTVASLTKTFDAEDGGFGPAPKFPAAQSLLVLLSENFRNDDKQALKMAEVTLEKMALSGMYDQLGGGFHRYSTDKIWLVPHFEKMLYDNAQLTESYLDAWRITGKDYYLKIAKETLDYTMRDLQDKNGGYYSSQDADSDKIEGKYYTWEMKQVEDILGKDKTGKFAEVYRLKEAGNYDSEDGRRVTILNRHDTKLSISEKEDSQWRQLLLKARYKRIAPLTDDKVLTAWNGLMITAMARAYKICGKKKYLDSASKAAHFILTKMRSKEGRLLRSSRLGQSKIHAFLDDYANLIEGLTHLYEADFDERWLKEAESLAAEMHTLFDAGKMGAYYYTANEKSSLITRSRSFDDNATPNGNASACLSFLRLFALTGKVDYRNKAEKIIDAASDGLNKWPRAYMKLVRCADFLINGSREIVIAAKDKESAQEWLKEARLKYHPSQVILLVTPESTNDYLKAKEMLDNKTTAYICYNQMCKAPINKFDEYKKSLDKHLK
ncbi:MAG: thioredoxin domain-containing protein, partial [Lentisphaeraceae bacterium]|nr:thioredoxin domain-containing protein [Lentisphaeraceae bacterium]